MATNKKQYFTGRGALKVHKGRKYEYVGYGGEITQGGVSDKALDRLKKKGLVSDSKPVSSAESPADLQVRELRARLKSLESEKKALDKENKNLQKAYKELEEAFSTKPGSKK